MKKLILALTFFFILEGFSMALQTHELPNGVQLVYKHVPGNKITSVQLWMKTGSVNETAQNNGISHFLEHMVFKGTEKFAPDEIDTLVEAKGGQMNAATSKDYTFYYITIPTFNVETAFNVISQMVFEATFPKEEIKKEKPVVIQEIMRKYDSPTYDMWTYLSETLFKNTPYAREVIGSVENIKSFDRQTLLKYYNSFYHPENMTLVVVGDLSEDKAKELAMQYFNKTKDANPINKSFGIPDKLNKNVKKVFEKDITQSYTALVYRAPSLMSEDKYELEVLTEILSGGEYSLLNEKLKNIENPLVNMVFGGYLGQKYGGSFTFFYTKHPSTDGDPLSKIREIIDNLQKGNLSEKDLKKAKNRLKAETVFQREKASNEAHDIGMAYTLGITDYYKDYVENIEAVELGDIKDVARKIFSDNYILVKTVPKNH
ncbi:M16 family metallopeptidase [Flexistipes sinusarabici]